MRLLPLLLALLVLAGCAGGPAPVEPPPPGLVTGTVVIAPCRPVERVGDPPCPPRPGIAVHFQRVGGGSTVTVHTDAAGSYSAQLAAGDYDARAEGGITPGPSKRVSVPAGGSVTQNFTVDSGIR